MNIISEKMIAYTSLVNYVLNTLVSITRKVRKGESLKDENAGAAQKVAELASICAQQEVCERSTVVGLAKNLHLAGYLPQGIEETFSSLTGWKFPVRGQEDAIEPLPISREPDFAVAGMPFDSGSEAIIGG